MGVISDREDFPFATPDREDHDMSDWPTWVWVIIGVVALVIIIAIIATGRRRPDALAPQNQDFMTTEGAEVAEPRHGEPDPFVVPTAAAPLVGDIGSAEQVTPRIAEVGEEPDDALPPADDVPETVADDIRAASEQARAEASEEVDELPEDHLVRHAEHGGAGGYDDERDEDHIPRDDLGRRLDPYGNPVDDGPPIPPSAMGRP